MGLYYTRERKVVIRFTVSSRLQLWSFGRIRPTVGDCRPIGLSVLHGPGLGPRAGPARSPWAGPGQVSIIVCGPGRVRA